MDNIFAYLGGLGCRDALFNKDSILDNAWDGIDIEALMKHIHIMKPEERQNRLKELFRKARADDTLMPPDTDNGPYFVQAEELADKVKSIFPDKDSLALRLTAEKPTHEELLRAIMATREFALDLFLRYHNQSIKDMMLHLAGKCFGNTIGNDELLTFMQTLKAAFDDPFSIYNNERTKAYADLKDTVFHYIENIRMRERDAGLENELYKFIGEYYSQHHIHLELQKLNLIFERFWQQLRSAASLGKTPSGLYDYLRPLAMSNKDMEAVQAKLSALGMAIRALGTTTPPTDKDLRDFKEYHKLSRLEESFRNAVLPVFTEELTFLMIGSLEYADSLYRLKIRNGYKTNQSEYIGAFDTEHRNMKKMIEYNSRKYNESRQDEYIKGFELGSAILNNQQVAKTVLPHFIRRVFDSGVSNGKQSEREALMDTLYDIGPVLGLVGASTTKRNPYLFPVDTAGNDAAIKNKPASVASFLNSFYCVPFDTASSRIVLDRCRAETQKEKNESREKEALKYLDTLTPEKLTVFGQFMTERFSHACLLERAYRVRSLFPMYVLQWQAKQPPIHDGIIDCYDFCADPLIKKLMILPMPRTRLCILQYLEDYLEQQKKRPPAETLRYLDILTKGLGKLAGYWTEIVIPWHILLCHYTAATFVSSYPNPKIQNNRYFGKALKDYCFYKSSDDKTVSVCSSRADGSCLQSKDEEFDAYAGKFYSYFVEESYNIIFSHNFAQQLERYGQGLASLKTRDELEKALLYTGIPESHGFIEPDQKGVT